MLAQTIEVREVIVVDDGSTDDTGAVIRELDDGRIHYVRQEHAGAAAARNRGVEATQGDYLAFVDADDLWRPDKLERQFELLDAGAGEMAFCGVDEFISPDLTAEERSGLSPRLGLRGPSICSLLISRRDYDRVGPMDPARRTGEFLDWFGRAQQAGLTACFTPVPLVDRRLHASNWGRRHRVGRTEYAQALKQLLDRRRAAPS